MISRNLCTLPLLFTLSSFHLANGAPQVAPVSYSTYTYQGSLNPEFVYLASEIAAAEQKLATSGTGSSGATNFPGAALIASIAHQLALSASSKSAASVAAFPTSIANRTTTASSASSASIAQQLALSTASESVASATDVPTQSISKTATASSASIAQQLALSTASESAASATDVPTRSMSKTVTASTASTAQQIALASSSAYAASLASSSDTNGLFATPILQVTPISQVNPTSGESRGTASAVGNTSAVALPSAFYASPSSLSGGGILLPLGNITSGIATQQAPSSSAGIIPTITTLPPGMSIQTIKSTKCSTYGAMATTTAAGSTVTQVVPKLCDYGFAFLLFGASLPAVAHLLYHNRLSILGFLLEFLYHPNTERPDGIRIIGAPPSLPPYEEPPPSYEDPPPYTPSPNGPEDPDDPDDEPSHTDSQPSHTDLQQTDSRRSQTSSQPSQTSSPFSSQTNSQPSQTSSLNSSQTNSQPSQTSSLRSQTNSRLSSITSTASHFFSSVSSASCTNTMSGGCCTNATVLTVSGVGPTTLCNFAIDTWVDVAYDFITGSIAIPASASPIKMPVAPMTVSDADVLFSSLARAMSSYLASASGLLSSSKPTSVTVAGSSTPQTMPTVWVTTTVSGSAFCSSGYETAGLSTTTIDGNTSSWCATPGAVVPTGPPTLSSVLPAAPAPTRPSPTSSPTTIASPTPSIGAFETWRQDSCDDTGCTSTIYGWDVGLAPAGQVIDPCTNSKYTYNYDFAESVANDNSNYTFTMKNINTLGYKGLEYLGSNDGYYEAPNVIAGRLSPSDGDSSIKTIFCNLVPGAVATSCSDPHSLDADDWTPVGYCVR